MKVFKQDDVYGLMSDLALDYLSKHNDYVIANFMSFGSDITLMKRNEKERKKHNEIHIKFDSIGDWSSHKYNIVMFTRSYNKLSKETKINCLYKSDTLYAMNLSDRVFTFDEELSKTARKLSSERFRAHDEDRLSKNDYKEIKDRVLNAKLLVKAEKLFGKKLKDQKLKVRKSHGDNDNYTSYTISFVYRGKTHCLHTNFIYDYDYDWTTGKKINETYHMRLVA